MKGKFFVMGIVLIIAMACATVSFGAVSAEEAKKLGTTLTPFGAQKEENKEGTIPAYTGGLTSPPASYVKGSGRRTDPFAGENRLFSVNAQNMAQYAGKLTEGTKELMKRYSTYRIDVYPTHRTAAYPDWVMKNTMKNALNATTFNGGNSMKGARAGIPFPIPKNGYEITWNHLTRYQGAAWTSMTLTYIVDSSGKLIQTGGGRFWQEFPYYEDNPSPEDAKVYWKMRWMYTTPARKAGEAGQWIDPLNPFEDKRVAYLYMPGQRRVKLAPELAFDAPTTDVCGNDTWDETWIFNGSMERYDVKFVEKTEKYVPYSNYKAIYWAKAEELFTPKHLNPDLIRWELHRVWVVDFTLKPGKRHIYAKRRIYFDEDTWAAVAGEFYDGLGKMFKVDFLYVTQNYDFLAPNTLPYSHYNLTNGVHCFQFWLADDRARNGTLGFCRENKKAEQIYWAAETLSSGGRSQ
jgi:hypothetical protein